MLRLFVSEVEVMERVSLEATRRESVGKSIARKLRRAGRVPAVIYGRGQETVPVAVDGKALKTALHTDAGLNVLIDLAIAGDGSRRQQTVMVKELQRGIFLREITHVDFHTISLEEKLEAHVPLKFIGQAKGIADGGVLEVILREIVVECLPTQIPEDIEVNINDLAIGDTLHIRDLHIPADIIVVNPPEEAVVTVVALKVVEEVAPAAAAPAEAAAGPEAGAEEAKPAEAIAAPEKGKGAEAKAAPEKGKGAEAKAAPEKPKRAETGEKKAE